MTAEMKGMYEKGRDPD